MDAGNLFTFQQGDDTLYVLAKVDSNLITTEFSDIPISAIPVIQNISIQLFPNPSDGTMFLNLTIKEPGEVELQITNIYGQRIYSKSLSNQTGTVNLPIDIPGNPAGVYIMALQIKEEVHYKKVVIH